MKKHVLNTFCLLAGLLAFAFLSIPFQSTAQPALAVDINPGAAHSAPAMRIGAGGRSEFALYKGKMYFAARTLVGGHELHSYDGTTVSPAADFRPGPNSAGADFYAIYNNILYVRANNYGVNGLEYFFFDGTTGGLLVDLWPGANHGVQGSAIVYNNKMYFRGNNGSTGWELYSYDGASVNLEVDIWPGTTHGFNGRVALYNNKLYFSGQTSAAAGTELYSYDGTSLSLVADIAPGSFAGNPNSLTVYNNKLFFSANTPATGFELFSYDGTSVSLVADINPGTGNGTSGQYTVYDGKLYFNGDNGTTGSELYVYDGTSVSLVADINPGPGRSYPVLAEAGGFLIFSADNPTTGRELYTYDGSNLQLYDLIPGATGSKPGHFTEYQGNVYFSANVPPHGIELWALNVPPPSSNTDPDCSGAAIADQIPGVGCEATISAADVTGITDADGDPLTITVSPTTLYLGANTVTVNADDGNGGTCSIQITVNVVGTADSDCDGVPDECDVCPGGDDSYVDENGVPYCLQVLSWSDYPADWQCGKNKVYVAKVSASGNPHTICVNINALQAHLNNGDYAGPLAECSTPEWIGTMTEQNVNSSVLESELSVFPNPASSELFISISAPDSDFKLDIIDQMGRVVWTESISKESSSAMFTADLSIFDDGIYFVRARLDGAILTKRIAVLK